MAAELSTARVAHAERYFNDENLLADQQGWYDRRAQMCKRWSRWLSMVILLAGALTGLVQLWAPSPDAPVHWTAVASVLLSALVIIAKGTEKVWNFDETWATYRQAAEALKRERRLYLTGVGPYVTVGSEGEAHRRFVERCEDIMAVESRSFWSSRQKETDESEEKSE